MNNSNYFEPADFKAYWNIYVDDYANIQDDTNKDVKDMIIEDLEDKGFSKEEIDELVKFEESDCNINSLPSLDTWTKFSCYAISLVNDFSSYDKMCDIIDEDLDKKLNRYEMPNKLGDEPIPNDILNKIYNWNDYLE